MSSIMLVHYLSTDVDYRPILLVHNFSIVRMRVEEHPLNKIEFFCNDN